LLLSAGDDYFLLIFEISLVNFSAATILKLSHDMFDV